VQKPSKNGLKTAFPAENPASFEVGTAIASSGS
jgi:hypothetical protein